MKNFFYSSLITLALPTLLYGQAGVKQGKVESTSTESKIEAIRKHLSPEHIANFIDTLEKQTLTKSPELMKKWHQLEADILEFKAKELFKIAEQIKDPKVRQAYIRVAHLKNRLAHKIAHLPIPEQPIKKSFEDIRDFLELKARKKALMAEMFKDLARQTGEKVFDEKARFMEHHADLLHKVLSEHQAAPKHKALSEH